METKDITTNNKLIAEFMGLTLYRGKWQRDTIATVTTICKENELKYNISFDWLMPVVSKIETTENFVTIVGNACRIKGDIYHEANQ